MGLFSSSKPEPAVASSPTSNTPSVGPGSEQERYATHFSIGKEGLDEIKDTASRAVHKVANYKGNGAEQDRYSAHFSQYQGQIDAAVQNIKQATSQGYKHSNWAIHGNLGHDGWNRATRLATTSGVGAEQDRFGSHFSSDDVKNAAHTAKERVKQATGTR